MTEVVLMNKDTPTIKMKGVNTTISEKIKVPIFHVEEAEFINKDLCPQCIFDEKSIVEQLNYWISKRSISTKRIDIPVGDIRWTGDVPRYFSMTDQYWFRYSEDEQWKDYNFFTNEFSTLVGDMVFSKNLHNIPYVELDYNSPDITTNGILKKRWRKENNINKLIKHTSPQFQQEAISEILATKLLEKLNMVKFVPYSLYVEGYDLCCMCKNFVTQNTEFVPAFHIYAATPKPEGVDFSKSENIYEHLCRAIEKFDIPDAKSFIDSMIIVDRMMLNFDRHLGNFGFLRDVRTGKYIEPAPLFDFGNAFFVSAQDVKENKKAKYFGVREEYLFENRKIQSNFDYTDLINDMNESVLLSDKQKKDITLALIANKDYIHKKNKEYDAKHDNLSKDSEQTMRMRI